MTIYDIAKMAGVSASTVSRVINEKPGIKESTREKVKQLLREYNYTPDENARGLVNRNTRLIGILVVDIRSAHHTDLAFVVENYLRERGYCAIIINAGPSEDQMAEGLKLLEQRRVDGALLVGSMFQNEQVKQGIFEHLREVPVVLANGYLDLPNVYGVLVDECDGVKRCVELLRKKGKEKLAYIGTMDSPSSMAKLKGYQEKMKEFGYDSSDLIIEEADADRESGYEATVRLLRKHGEVDGIIYSEDVIAAGAVRAFWDLGYKIPEDKAVLGIDNTIYGELTYPKLTSLDNKMTEMAYEAARILVEAVEGKTNTKRLMLFSDIVEREST
ncbi:LacI family DNA-binding transcriptional regulator [Murimonas intestini]|uniref:LacI family DNA-binding transcriptional regulator n=1 Tax=Murimonas intestini TaxID=1337051 RepID=UPI00248BF8D6|nr:LacI family DNA-binding transcriptional regulator [Murimonas intestini]